MLRGGGFQSTARSKSAPALRRRGARGCSRAVEAVELARVLEQRRVAALADVFENRRDDALGFVPDARRLRVMKLLSVVRCSESESCHITILFSGYSTMPCAPASFSRGMMVRTVDSSRMVLTREPVVVAEARWSGSSAPAARSSTASRCCSSPRSASARLCPAH